MGRGIKTAFSRKVMEIRMDDLISREKLFTEIEEMNIASFWEENEHSAEVYREIKQLIKSMEPEP